MKASKAVEAASREYEREVAAAVAEFKQQVAKIARDAKTASASALADVVERKAAELAAAHAASSRAAFGRLQEEHEGRLFNLVDQMRPLIASVTEM